MSLTPKSRSDHGDRNTVSTGPLGEVHKGNDPMRTASQPSAVTQQSNCSQTATAVMEHTHCTGPGHLESHPTAIVIALRCKINQNFVYIDKQLMYVIKCLFLNEMTLNDLKNIVS